MPLYLCFNFFLVFNPIICVSRYRVEVMVNYKDENKKFLLWDRECTELRSYFMELFLFIIVICISYLYAYLFLIDYRYQLTSYADMFKD